MLENSRVDPLNWDELVQEALRRRRTENLTQREHAALASVSIPTMIAFERGERSLSLAKAFDILRVVGLVVDGPENGVQETFVRDAFKRWRKLTTKLAQDSPARFPHGWYRFDYALEGELEQPDLHELHKILERISVRHTGWPMFVTMTRKEFEPYEADGVLEAWIKPGDDDVDRFTTDAAHCDFWRAAPSGRMFLIRGYQEDSQEAVQPGTIFDTTVPIWRLAEVLLHASRLSERLQHRGDSEVTVRFRCLYTGLRGRVLRSMRGDFIGETLTSRSDEAALEVSVSTAKIKSDLPSVVYPLAASLYERFGVAQLSHNLVNAEIARFRSNTF